MKRGLFNDDGPIKTKQKVRPAQQMTPEMKIEIEKKEKNACSMMTAQST